MKGFVLTEKADGNRLMPVPDEWTCIEHSTVRRILICEKNIERFSQGDMEVLPFAYAVSLLKQTLLELSKELDVHLTPEALKWLREDSPMGPWCPFWFKWKNEVVWNESECDWTIPEWEPGRLAALMILADGCDNCMNACFDSESGCLAGVRKNIDDLPYWEKFACSHFIADDQEYPDLGSDTGIEEETMSENHRRNWKERGCPVYGPEESRLPVADTP